MKRLLFSLLCSFFITSYAYTTPDLHTAWLALPDIDEPDFMQACSALQEALNHERARVGQQGSLDALSVQLAARMKAYQSLMTLSEKIDTEYSEHVQTLDVLRADLEVLAKVSSVDFLVVHGTCLQRLTALRDCLHIIFNAYEQVAMLTDGSLATVKQPRAVYEELLLQVDAFEDMCTSLQEEYREHERMFEEIKHAYTACQHAVTNVQSSIAVLPGIDDPSFVSQHAALMRDVSEQLAQVARLISHYEQLKEAGFACDVVRSCGDYVALQERLQKAQSILHAQERVAHEAHKEAVLLDARYEKHGAVLDHIRQEAAHVLLCDVEQSLSARRAFLQRCTAELTSMSATMQCYDALSQLAGGSAPFVKYDKAAFCAMRSELEELFAQVRSCVTVSDTDIFWHDLVSDETFISSRITGDWVWKHAGHAWTYTAKNDQWRDTQTGETWTYDAAHAWWENSSAHGRAGMKWEYDEKEQCWHYAGVKGQGWSSPDARMWTFRCQPAGSDWGFVPQNETWEYVSGAQRWKQKGQAWRYLSHAQHGQWEHEASGEKWVHDNLVCHTSSNTLEETVWSIHGQESPRGYDNGHWVIHPSMKKAYLGPYEQVAWNDGTPELTDRTGYLYDEKAKQWYPQYQGSPHLSGAGKTLLPLFPPTPFAPQRACIERVLAQVSLVWGGPDGMRVAPGSYGIAPDGRCALGDIRAMRWHGDMQIDGDIELDVTQSLTVTVDAEKEGTPVRVSCAPGATHAHLIFNVAAGQTLTFDVKSDLFFEGSDQPLSVTFRGEGTTRFLMPSGRTISFSKVRTHIVMEQSEQEALKERRSQVVFEKVSGQQGKTIWIKIGQDTHFAFISPHEKEGYGSLAFDTSLHDTGRMVLALARGDAAGDGRDGGLHIYGCAVQGTGKDGCVCAADIRTRVSYNKPAGAGAVLRICDDVQAVSIARNPANPTARERAAWHARTPDDRRGLVVINHCATFPTLARSLGAMPAGEPRTGFVLGCNGHIEIDDTCFLDYIAGSTNRRLAYLDPSRSKLHNPSALIIDGGTCASDRSAQITLYGRAGVYVRCGASSQTGGLLAGVVARDDGEVVDATISKGIWNGAWCVVPDVHQSIARDAGGAPRSPDGGRYCLDGEHVLDVEGALTIRSVPARFGVPASGYVNVPSRALDHAGQVMGGASLVKDKAYDCYNASSVLLNAPLTLDQVRWEHDDVLRNLTPSVTESALPAILGGERSSLRGDTSGGLLCLCNSQIACHSSLVLAGVRVVVHEKKGAYGRSAHNRSSIVAYHEGQGRGVLVQLGSSANRMADGSRAASMFDIGEGVMSSSSLRDSFIEVYRAAPTRGASAAKPTLIELALRSQRANGVSERKRGLHHLFLAHQSQINLGWMTEQGAATCAPWHMSEERYEALKATQPSALFSPSEAGSGTLCVAGGPWVLSAQESKERAPVYPITATNTGGVVYVDHGGVFAASDKSSMLIDTLVACHLTSQGSAGKLSLDPQRVTFGASGKVQPYTHHEGASGLLALHANASQVAVRTGKLTAVKAVSRGIRSLLS